MSSRPRAPRTFGLSDEFDAESLVAAAWAAGETWEACDADTIEAMKTLSDSGDPGVRYWGTRGLALGVLSHAAVFSEDAIAEATGALTKRLSDSSPSVRLAAADVLVDFQDEAMQKTAADELMNLADLPQEGDFIAIAALNVIDRDRETVQRLSGKSVSSLRGRWDDTPARGGDYVQRLLDTDG